MEFIIRKSEALVEPDDCGPQRKLFIDNVSPVEFEISFYDEEAIELWDKSPEEYLPILPWGYHWEKVKDKYGIYKLNYAADIAIQLILYGPNIEKKINYNLLVDGKNFYSLAHTNSDRVRLAGRDRKYPDPIKRDASGYSTALTQYMPGHCIDHVDTIIPPEDVIKKYGLDCYSSFNSNNYIPEVQKDYWGLYMRKGLVDAQRKAGQNYAQLTEYTDAPIFTESNTAIPESVYFFRLDGQYKPQQVSWIDWSKDYNQQKKPKEKKMIEHMQDFSTNLETAPRLLLWDLSHSDRTWRKEVRDNRILGHNIREARVASYSPNRDQIYAYGRSSVLEYTDNYSSISTALAASSEGQGELAKTNLIKAAVHGSKLLELDEKRRPVDANRWTWVHRYHKEGKPGFEDEGTVDAIKQLSHLGK